MAKIFIIHGYAGYSEENWFPWLRQELEKSGHQVIVPDFPHPSNPQLREWLIFFEDNYRLDPGSIVVGHSLGGAFLLSLLEKTEINSAFFVAGVSGPIEYEVDSKIKTFTHKTFDWAKIKNNGQHFTVFHSDNDPYIPLSQAAELADHLGASVTLIKNGGHLNHEAGFRTFPLLLQKITERG